MSPRVQPLATAILKGGERMVGVYHGLINYIDTKAKCRHLKILTCKGTFRQVFICLRTPPLLGLVWGGLAIL
jgi:hypothetical protein